MKMDALRGASAKALANCRGERAFTFVEVLAALLFLAVVVPTIVSALSLSNRASEVAERGTAAGQLSENKLNEMLVHDAWQTASATSGDCGADWPNYRWQLTQTAWSTDSASNMTELKVEVFYKLQGVERSVAVNTLVNTLAASGTTTTSGTTSSGTTGNADGSTRAGGTGTGGGNTGGGSTRP